MTDSRLKMILQTATNLVFGSLIAAGWLMGKVDSSVALLPLLALAGLDVLGRRNENASSRSLEAPGGPKAPPPLPPPGPTAVALLMAMEAVRGLIG